METTKFDKIQSCFSLRKKCFALKFSAHHVNRGFKLCLATIYVNILFLSDVTSMSYTTIHLISPLQHMLCYWSYAPFELCRNAHFNIRSGQFCIKSQHWNIVIKCPFPQMTYSIYWPTKDLGWRKKWLIYGKMKAPVTVRNKQLMNATSLIQQRYFTKFGITRHLWKGGQILLTQMQFRYTCTCLQIWSLNGKYAKENTGTSLKHMLVALAQ